MSEFRHIHLAVLVPVVIFILAIGVFTIFASSKSGEYIFEERHEIVKGQVVSKQLLPGCLLSTEKFGVSVTVDGKEILFHASIGTGLKVREGQTILLSKTTYLTKNKKDGKVVNSASYYNWYKW